MTETIRERQGKLSEEDVILIRRLRASGRTLRELADDFGCSTATIEYWTNEGFRQAMKARARRRSRRIYQIRKEEIKANYRERYASDPEYRERCKLSSKRYTQRMKAERAGK